LFSLKNESNFLNGFFKYLKKFSHSNSLPIYCE